jgi:nucleotide-binding universal stress UspA family protein
MKDILIPTDFSANSWNALKYAVCLFKNEACNFYMLHIGSLKDSDTKSTSFTLPTEKKSPSAKERLHVIFKRIHELPFNEKHHFIALQEYGNFIDIIRKTIKVKKIALIIMGTKGASGLKATVIGSNTGDVITKVLCNVLVIPENAAANKPKQIAFPTDYNLFYTHRILEAITEMYRISKARLHVLNVSKSNTPLTNTQEIHKLYLKDYLGELFPSSHNFHNISDKNVKTAILNFIADNQIEMVAMVAKNLNFFQQLLFDTTIEKLSFHTTVPMLVLHE